MHHRGQTRGEGSHADAESGDGRNDVNDRADIKKNREQPRVGLFPIFVLAHDGFSSENVYLCQV